MKTYLPVSLFSILFIVLSAFSFNTLAQAPDGHPFSEVTEGMDESEVRSIVGKPSRRTSHQTGKSWIPVAGRWLNDTRRHTWFYKGKGHITFSKNRYSGLYLVREVVYDPKQR